MKMDSKNGPNGIFDDPLKHNEAFLKHHRKISFSDKVYCTDLIERIEKKCGCKVICNPHFNGISFYIAKEHYEAAKTVISEVHGEERVKEERDKRLKKRKAELSKKIKQRFHERMAQCEQPDDIELRFAEQCLKTLRLEDYVPEKDAEKYRRLYKRYSQYFQLVNWPENLTGDAAKMYINKNMLRYFF